MSQKQKFQTAPVENPAAPPGKVIAQPGSESGRPGRKPPDRRLQERIRELEAANAHLLKANQELEARLAGHGEADAQPTQEAYLLQAVLDVLPVGVWVFDRAGKITQVNLAGRQIWDGSQNLGIAPFEKYVGWWVGSGERVAADQWPAARAMREGREILNQEIEIQSFDSSRKIVRVSAAPIRNANQQIVGAVRVVEDITERKKNEWEVQQERAKLRNILDSMQDGVYICSSDYQVEYTNPVIDREFGSVSERRCYEYLHERSDPCPWCKNPEVLVGNTVLLEWQSAKTGKTYEVLERPLTNADGSVSKLKIMHDITERKRAEESLQRSYADLQAEIAERKEAETQLRQRENLLSTVLETLPVGVWILDRSGKIVQVNAAGKQIWGGSKDPGLGWFGDYTGRWVESGEPVTAEQWPASRALREGIISLNEEIEIRSLDGARKITLISAVPIRNARQEISGTVVIIEDITGRHRSQAALRQNEKLLRMMLEALPVGVWMQDSTGRIMQANPEGQRIWAGAKYVGIEQFGEYKGWWLNTGKPIAPEEWAGVRAFEKGETSLNEEIEIECFDGTHRIILNSALPIWDEQHKFAGSIIVNMDITELKRAEAERKRNYEELQALSEAERKARQLAETLRDASMALSQSLDLETVMNVLLEFTGRLVPYDSAHIALLENETELKTRASRGNRDPEQAGQTQFRPVSISASPCLQELFTTRKSVLIDDTCADAGWRPLCGSANVRNWFGLPLVSEGQVIGLCCLEKTEPGFFTREHIQLAETIVGQAAVAIQNAWLFEQVRQGRQRLQSLSRRLVEVQEQERRYIARELHDDASQTLASLVLGFHILEQHANDPARTRKDVVKLRATTEGVLESLHRLAIDLRPASLDHTGLVPAVQQLVQTLNEHSKIRFRFKDIGEPLEKRAPVVEINLYRIVQEALNNVIRHAHATQVDVILEFRKTSIHIIIEDNGIGFEKEKIGKGGHLGLVGMQERIEMLGGTLEIDSAPGSGTTLVVEAPYGD